MFNSFDEIQMDMEYTDLTKLAIDELRVKRRNILKRRRTNRDVEVNEINAYVDELTEIIKAQ